MEEEPVALVMKGLVDQVKQVNTMHIQQNILEQSKISMDKSYSGVVY